VSGAPKKSKRETFEEFVEFLVGTADDSLPWFAKQHAKLVDRIAANERKKPIDHTKAARLAEAHKALDDDRKAVAWAKDMLHQQMGCLREVSNKLPGDGHRELLFFALVVAMGAAFEIGSRANASDSAREFTRSTTGAFGGKKSGKVRAVKAWHQPARELAIKMRATNPRISNTRMSELISEKVNGSPSDRQVRPFLTALQSSGDLPPRRPAK
jgi:hypothetical protein